MGRGDTEQWIFPEITLTEKERKLIIAEVWAITTEKMFHHHLYTFGGRTYRQRRGGPIGLRGTCVIARLIMCSWDRKWGEMMRNQKLEIWKYMRYMDDGRVFLQPIKRGWRWMMGEMVYCRRWEKEDHARSLLDITLETIRDSMKGVTNYLTFTFEAGSDYQTWK